MGRKLISVICFLFLIQACVYPVRYDGPYKGRIIDAETGAPVEGVVVLGVWSEVAVSPGGGVSSYYDAQETISDKNGDFEIKGLGLKLFSSVAPMNVLVFKAGYSSIGMAPWESHEYEGGLMKDKAKVEGDRVILLIRKLTLEERKARLFGKEDVPDNKQRLLIREINKESLDLGLPPYEEVR